MVSVWWFRFPFWSTPVVGVVFGLGCVLRLEPVERFVFVAAFRVIGGPVRGVVPTEGCRGAC